MGFFLLHAVWRQGGVGHERHGPGPFKGRGQQTLVPSAIAGYPSGNYFAPFGDEIPEDPNVLEIYGGGMFSAKTANLPPVERLSLFSAARIHLSFS